MAKAPQKTPEPEENAENAEADNAESAAKKKKLLLIIAIVVALLAIAGGGTFAALHFMGGDEKTAEPADAEHADGEGKGEDEGKEGEAAAPVREPLVYFPLEPPFLTNFVVNGRPRYLQLSLTVASRDNETIAALQKHLPLVRNRIVMLLSGEQFDQLRTRPGREALQLKVQDAVKQVLEKETGKADVERILFTNFVMQ